MGGLQIQHLAFLIPRNYAADQPGEGLEQTPRFHTASVESGHGSNRSTANGLRPPSFERLHRQCVSGGPKPRRSAPANFGEEGKHGTWPELPIPTSPSRNPTGASKTSDLPSHLRSCSSLIAAPVPLRRTWQRTLDKLAASPAFLFLYRNEIVGQCFFLFPLSQRQPACRAGAAFPPMRGRPKAGKEVP